MYSDLVGLTALSARMVSEDLREVISAYRNASRKPCAALADSCHFLMLMRNERLAKLRTIFDHSSHTLSLAREGREVARGDLHTEDRRAAVERYFAEFCADELRGPPKILCRP